MTCIEHIGGGDYRVALPNGRGLGFAQYGDPCGKPVVSFHGGLSCRLDSQFADALSRQAGVRLIAPDRPGIGLSDPLPEGTLLDYPDDVVYLADALGIERFAALGWSAGGAYALACAYKIPGRLTRVGLIASVAPLRHLGGAAVSGLGVDRVLLSLSRTLPKAAALILEGCRFGPPALMKQVVSRHVQSGPDRDLIASLSVREATAWFYEALRPGGMGAVRDYQLIGREWGFEVGGIESHCILWRGEQDAVLPEAHTEYLARTLGRSELRLIPSCGHFLLHRRTSEVLEALTAT